MAGVAPVTVIVPTIGRVELLTNCLVALARCRPAPAEVLVVDQSGDDRIRVAVAEAGVVGRVVPSQPPGISRALNIALAVAAYETVLVTHDDCRVREDWVGVAARLISEAPDRLATGRVLPAGGDPRMVPSTITWLQRREFHGWRAGHVLYPSNMALTAGAATELGGFDERFTTAAEDNDFCYRWLRSGRRVLYEPDLVVWHEDWRTPQQLKRLYAGYWRAQGEFYAKHLRRADTRVLRFALRDLRAGAAALNERIRHKRARWTDPRRGAFIGLPVGLVRGWRAMR
jgi:O-antigen biosynthesis protein